MTIKQFNANWVSHEDRILLRFNTVQDQEYRLWLTRHTLKDLLENAQKLIQASIGKTHRPEVAELIESFQKQKIQNKIVSGVGFTESKAYPLGEKPLLVTNINVLSDSKRIKVSFQLVSKQKIEAPMNIKALQSLVYLLEKSQETAGWFLDSSYLDGSSGDGENSLVDEKVKKLIH
jgi:hypothetical protein